MDGIIQKAVFNHNDSQKQDDFFEAITDFRNNRTIGFSPADILKALSVLEAKLVKEPQPVYDTAGWQQALKTSQEIRDGCRELRENSNAMQQLQSGFYSFLVHLLAYKLNMLHLKIALDYVRDYYSEMTAYIQKLDRNELQPFISTLGQNITLENGVEGRKFGEMYQQFVRTFVEDTLTKEQVKTFTAELLDLAVYLYLDCKHLQEDLYRNLTETGKYIIRTLDDPFTHTQDLDRLRSYLRRCSETFKEPRFPPHHRAASETESFMSDFLKKLAKRGLLEEIYEDVFDLIHSTAKCTYDKDNYNVKLFSIAYYFFRNLPKKILKKNPQVFVAMSKRYRQILEDLDVKFLQERYARDVLDDGLFLVYADNKQVSQHWVELSVPLLRQPTLDTLKACYTIFQEDKGYKWKNHPDIADQVFELIKGVPVPDHDAEEDEKAAKKKEEFLKAFTDAVKYFFEGLKKSKIVKNYSHGMMNLTLKFMQTKHTELFELAEEIAERIELNVKEDKDIMVEKMKQFHELLKDEDHPWVDNWPLQRAANDFIDSCLEPFKDGKVFTDEDLSVFVSICLTCLEHDFIDPDTGRCPSSYFSIYLTTMGKLNNWLKALNKMELAADIIPPLLEGLKLDDDSAVQLSAMYIYLIANVSSGQKILAPYLEELIKLYLDIEQNQLLQVITQVYPVNPKALKGYFPSLMSIFEDTGEPTLIMYLAQLFQLVSKKQAELFREQDIQTLLTKAKEHMDYQSIILDVVKELCKRRPEGVVPFIDTLRDKTAWNPHMSYWINEMLCTLAMHKKDLAPIVLEDLLSTVKSGQDKTQVLSSFNTMRMIGFKYPDLIKPRRAEISGIQLTDVDEINMRQMILDMIDGKTSDEMLNQLQQQQQDLQDLVGRVDETEEAVAEVKNELGQQGEQLGTVKKEVKEQGQRLDEVEQTVDDTVAKVEEIDQKTLSHAPYWARDISKLLTPVSEHDWRLLCSRLGYSNDDIRGWAQQADPCMAMLNEWYATRKTSEATFAILTQLQEMNRMDAAIIVENAMKNAAAVMEDEDFVYATPPPIFISYQWAHQPEVKLLKQHLEMAGYDCWMDIGQMGGGDKLFEKIDNGIRAAKIIISCVTAKYAKSPNCNREVNLAVNLNKPVIPLLLEKCTWPPPGSMGPIFSEYLFIRFFQRTGEETTDDRYWSKDKFQELLMQLSMFGLPPDEGKIEPEYKNWWMPVVEKIKIDKNKTKNGGQVSQVEETDLDKKAAESPDVFISYQWGKQKNIIKLYERLTSLGLTCWLDIKQMGGGDSLYDKIDRGVRGCKVVLSCVTQKYALSANCRREVSLADALKKPLLPLLLEQMTWPPPGPMSMVMTQLLYINFSKDEYIQVIWDGPQFKELLSKIYEHVPRVTKRDEKQATDENKTKSTAGSGVGTNTKELSSGQKISSTSQPSRSNNASTKPHHGEPSLAAKSYPYKTSVPQAVATHQMMPAKKPESSSSGSLRPVKSKVAAVNKFSSGTRQFSRPSPNQQPKTDPQLSVPSRPLLKPLPSNSAKKLPSTEHQPQPRPSVRPPPSQQSRSTLPRASQRPTRLPPLQHLSSKAEDTASSGNPRHMPRASRPPPSNKKITE